jgi:hypothetical protein
MQQPDRQTQAGLKQFRINDLSLLLLSTAIQLVVGLLFGHIYDMRIFMATGYLVGTGQNPYIPQDLSSVFHNPTFQAITTVGYPPPWPLMLGVIYRVVYAVVPNFLVYNLAIKLPIIAANIALAWLVAVVLKRLGAQSSTARKAWIFMLFNPFLLYASTAWGQFDSIVALLCLGALLVLDQGKVKRSAVLLALAIAFKPTPLALIPIAFFYLKDKPFRQTLSYYGVLFISSLLFWVAPFYIFGWDPAPILQNWNGQFAVGGGVSFMAFLELVNDSYQLTGVWSLAGSLWVPAVAVAAWLLRPNIVGFRDLLIKSTALIMVFFLTRTWLSEPNIILILPLALILTSMGDLDRRSLAAIWVVPLIFSFFNTATAQMFFPSMPGVMDQMLKLGENYRTLRLVAKVLVVIPWEIAGWWIVFRCIGTLPAPAKTTTDLNAVEAKKN